jgi:hypothetical protein
VPDASCLVIAGTTDQDRSEVAFLRLLESDSRFVVGHAASLDEAQQLVRAEFSSVTLFLKAGWLHRSPEFRWGDYPGRRCLLDHDIYANYTSDPEMCGAWDPVFAANHFDVVVTSGLRVRDQLVDDGVNAVWLPKAYDPEVFSDLGGARRGWCTFGARYPARRAIAARLDRDGVDVRRVQAPYRELNARLNQFLGCVICNLDGAFRFGRYGAKITAFSGERLAPSLVRLGDPTEAMFKNFEAAAAGCAVICDRSDDVIALGFVDGESVIQYGDVDELVEKLRMYSSDPEACRTIAAAGRDLVRSRHTWAHRVDGFYAAIKAE